MFFKTDHGGSGDIIDRFGTKLVRTFSVDARSKRAFFKAIDMHASEFVLILRNSYYLVWSAEFTIRGPIMTGKPTARSLPFYYGWVIFAVTFLT